MFSFNLIMMLSYIWTSYTRKDTYGVFFGKLVIIIASAEDPENSSLQTSSVSENHTLSTETLGQPEVSNPPQHTSTPIKDPGRGQSTPNLETAPRENVEAEEAVVPGQVAANISISVVGQNETDEVKRVKKGSVG